MSDPETALRRLLDIMIKLRDPGGARTASTLKTLTP